MKGWANYSSQCNLNTNYLLHSNLTTSFKLLCIILLICSVTDGILLQNFRY